MVYGSGSDTWQNDNTLNNRHHNGNSSYQASPGYHPPNEQNFADQQTDNIEDTRRIQHQAEGTAAEVLSQMNIQGDQLKGADKNVWKLRESLEKSKQQLDDLIVKIRKKKLRLQIIAGILASIDLILFFRLVVCGGTFFCRSY